MTGTVLVVEDDTDLRSLLVRGLRREGFDPEPAPTAATALAAIDRRTFDAVVLDVGLPDADGLSVCQALRAAGVDTPVLFLTGRSRLPDVLAAFSAGGDDHVAKPFALSEVVVRLQALIRRRPAAEPSGQPPVVRLDPGSHQVVGPGGSAPVTPTEYRLLAALLAADGAVVPRRALAVIGWSAGALVQDNTLDQYVSRLRRKVATTGGDALRLVTVHGVGYRLERTA